MSNDNRNGYSRVTERESSSAGMQKDSGSVLTSSQEQLLMRYVDKESGLIDSWRIKRLLKSSCASQAEAFLIEMRSINSSLSMADDKSINIDVWDKVSQRIDSEEHAALFLGSRDFKESNRSRTGSFLSAFNNNRLLIAVPTAAACAVLALIFLPTAGNKGVNVPSNSQSSIAQINVPNEVVVPVSVGGGNNYSVQEDPWEVEWLRSDGRVRVIQNSRGRVPILWIKRTPGRSLDSSASSQVHTLSDGSQLRILDNNRENVPKAFTVANE